MLSVQTISEKEVDKKEMRKLVAATINEVSQQGIEGEMIVCKGDGDRVDYYER